MSNAHFVWVLLFFVIYSCSCPRRSTDFFMGEYLIAADAAHFGRGTLLEDEYGLECHRATKYSTDVQGVYRKVDIGSS